MNVMVLMFGSVLCVPLACYSVGVLYRRAGMKSGWTLAFNILAGSALFGVVSFFMNVKGPDLANVSLGMGLIFVPAILVTAAAGYLAFRRWPAEAPQSGGNN